MKNFRNSLRNAIFSINFLVSLTASLLLLISPIFEQLASYIKYGGRLPWIYFLDLTMTTGSFCIFAPLLAAFPYTSRFCEEYESGYINSILVREHPVRYLLTKFFVNGVAGGLALSMPLALFIVVLLFNGTPYRVEDVPEGFVTIYERTIFQHSQFLWGGIAVLLIFLFLTFLSGAVWANVGLCFSVFVRNKYLAVGFPLVMYYGVTVILVGTDIFGFSPMNLIYPTTTDSVPLYINIPFQLTEFALICAVFTIKGKAVLRNV